MGETPETAPCGANAAEWASYEAPRKVASFQIVQFLAFETLRLVRLWRDYGTLGRINAVRVEFPSDQRGRSSWASAMDPSAPKHRTKMLRMVFPDGFDFSDANTAIAYIRSRLARYGERYSPFPSDPRAPQV